MTAIWKPAFWTCVLAVLVLSLAPTPTEMPTTGWDKSNHVVGFLALAVLGLLAYPRDSVAILLGLLLYGGLIEILQSFTTYRLAEWADWIADGVGVIAGYGLDLLWRRFSRAKLKG